MRMRMCRHYFTDSKTYVNLLFFEIFQFRRTPYKNTLYSRLSTLSFYVYVDFAPRLTDSDISFAMSYRNTRMYLFDYLTSRQRWVALYFLVQARVYNNETDITIALDRFDWENKDLLWMYRCANVGNNQIVFTKHSKLKSICK